jgi:hypothetical protein
MCVLGVSSGIACLKGRPFNAEAFFLYQRQLGLDPYVRDGSIGFRLSDNIVAACLHEWADQHDPNGAARLRHASEAWKLRLPDQKIVSLGKG